MKRREAKSKGEKVRYSHLNSEFQRIARRDTHSSILAWRIPWTEEPGELPSMDLQESDMTEGLMLPLSAEELGRPGSSETSQFLSPKHGVRCPSCLDCQSSLQIHISSEGLGSQQGSPLPPALLPTHSCHAGLHIQAPV